jgi:hypothetical protein
MDFSGGMRGRGERCQNRSGQAKTELANEAELANRYHQYPSQWVYRHHQSFPIVAAL